jgi:hypothetical protein
MIGMSDENVKPEIKTEQSTATPTTPAQPEIVKLEFYIFASDQQKLNDFIEMAYLLKLIPEQNMQRYMAFCLNCGAGYLQQKVNGK